MTRYTELTKKESLTIYNGRGLCNLVYTHTHILHIENNKQEIVEEEEEEE